MKLNTLFEEIDLFSRISLHIKNKTTGTPLNFAKMVGMSKRQIHRYIEDMKDVGVKIGYCKKRKTYHYEDDTFLKFQASIIEKGQERKIVGGENIFNNFENNF